MKTRLRNQNAIGVTLITGKMLKRIQIFHPNNRREKERVLRHTTNPKLEHGGFEITIRKYYENEEAVVISNNRYHLIVTVPPCFARNEK